MLAFLEKLKITTPHIIAFDDDLRALQSIGKICNKKKIACTLFWYRHKELMPETWNTRQALQSFEALKETYK